MTNAECDNCHQAIRVDQTAMIRAAINEKAMTNCPHCGSEQEVVFIDGKLLTATYARPIVFRAAGPIEFQDPFWLEAS